MESRIVNRKKVVRRMALADHTYQTCNEEFLEAERLFLEMIPELTVRQQDIVWRFVNLSNEIDERILEIACEYLDL